jgi:hypothetical protein
MSRRMRINSVTLRGAGRKYEFPFTRNCTILDGPVGTGKSSLLELIKYGFGGQAVLTPVVRSEIDQVLLNVSIEGRDFWLKRNLGKSSRYVVLSSAIDPEESETLPVRGDYSHRSISDALLAAINIPNVEIPRARTRASAETVRLTFNDLYSYLYVEQQDIDRSVVHHTETFRDPKRRAVFELLFGLADPGQLTAESELGRLREELKAANSRAELIESFLETAGVESYVWLRSKSIELSEIANNATAELIQLRETVAARTTAHEKLRNRIASAEAASEVAERELAESRSEVSRREELLAQFQLDSFREDKARSASRRLSPLEFVMCPRCLQELPESRADSDHCHLCLQEVAVDYASTPDVSLVEAEDQVDELEELLTKAREICTERESRLKALQRGLAMLREDLDLVTAEAVAPRFGEIELLSARRASALVELDGVGKYLKFWEELNNIRDSARGLASRIAELEEIISSTKSRLSQRRLVLDELSSLFDETVRSLGVPWANSAAIDPKTYLPTVDGERFETLAVAGGTKTVVTVAYHLTLLAHALEQRDTLLPQLLILDTPRKNLGFNLNDSEMGDRIYSRIQTLVDAYGSEVQFIIADNDLPRAWDGFSRIHVDYNHPLIPHVLHPGEDAVREGRVPTVSTINRKE